MIIHDQASGNSRLNFNDVEYDLLSIPDSVIITGSLVLAAGSQMLNATFTLSSDQTFVHVFVCTDGSLTSIFAEGENMAHLCWYDGTNLNVIRHT